MKNYDYWKSFVNTGKIDDYLHYIACTQEEISDEIFMISDIPKRSADIEKEGGFIADLN